MKPWKKAHFCAALFAVALNFNGCVYGPPAIESSGSPEPVPATTTTAPATQPSGIPSPAKTSA